MKFTQRIIVLGARHFNDTIEGQKHDFTKVRVQMEVPAGSKTEIGFNSSEWPWGDSSNFSKIKHLPFPCECEMQVQATTKGFEVVDMKPLAPAKAA